MVDVMGKVIAVVLAVILIIFAPLLITANIRDLEMRRGILNETHNFIDIVCDTGAMTGQQVEDFYLAIASYGSTMDIHITRYARTVNPDGTGGVVVTYIPMEPDVIWIRGDMIQVTVEAIDYTGAQRLMYQLLHFNEPRFNVTLAGMVRM